jgi:hypothetical protein
MRQAGANAKLERIGGIAEVGGAFVAYDSAGALIGKFKTLREASRAIPRVTR